MNRKALIIILSLCPAFHIQAQDFNPQPISADKIRLTEEQQLKGLPADILGKPAKAVKMEGGGRITYKYGNRYYRYNYFDGTSIICTFSKPDTNSDRIVESAWVNPTYSPDSTRIAYTLDNDLDSVELSSGKKTRYTYDGGDAILNGYASWVYYEEIFGRESKYKAFWWSPDSKMLAYYRFDNSKVPMFPIYNSEGQHGFINETRYPKAGDPNPKVKIGFVNAEGGETQWADFPYEKDQYFGIPFWSGDGKRFMVSCMPRTQDDLELFSVDPYTGRKISVYTEHQNSWIDWMEQMLFVKDGIYIVRDFTGWQQIYFLSYDGKQFKQLTDDRFWSVNLLKVNRDYLIFTAKRESTTKVGIYRLSLKRKNVERLSDVRYSYRKVMVSDDLNDIAAYESNCSTPERLVALSLSSRSSLSNPVFKTIRSTAGEKFSEYAYATAEEVTLTMRDGVKLPALVVWPVDFDPSRKYPVKVFVYGGPDNPMVNNVWSVRGVNQWWANHGVIQVVLDNRASGHLGKRGIEQAYRQLGIVEVNDFIDGIKCFIAKPYVDASRTGISGFSFGGTMTALCVTEGSEYFKFGIAGGGVYDWALYDSHYTERYMDTPKDNPEGYESTDVLGRLSNYKGDSTNYLRITHGTGDDNVHFQQTLQLVDTLQKQCKDFELMIYPQALHGYKGAQGRHSEMQDYIFWYKHLLDSPLPPTLTEYYKQK